MGRWARKALIAFFLLFLGLNFAAAGLLVWLSGSAPLTHGRLQLAGPETSILIRRDDAGVAFVQASSPGDSYFALGFVHAQDRLWQMEQMRRVGAGRLAEIVGRLGDGPGQAALRYDRFTRALGLYARAEAAYQRASPALKLALDRYAAGVNAFLDSRQGALPPEFVLMRHSPEPWRPADSLVWQQLMALQLGTNWTSELLRQRMLDAGISLDHVLTLLPVEDAEAPATRQGALPTDGGTALATFLDGLPAALAPAGASNAWAIAGDRTASGKPILANDPHLALTDPNLWYLARIATPEGVLAGATVPGVPFHILGHNGRIAWGFSTPHIDSQDLFAETVDPSDPARYLTPDGSRPFATRDERFRIGDRETLVTLRETRHGPVISDVWRDAARPAPGTVLALASPSFAEDDGTAEAILALNRAGSVAEALAALDGFHSPAQVVTLADTAGAIAMTTAGRLPLRAGGGGYLPAGGASGSGDWLGWVPRTAMPEVRDPADGMVVHANDRLQPRDPALRLGGEYDPPDRARRIAGMIEASPREATDAAASTRIQMDAVSPPFEMLFPGLLDRARSANAAGPATAAALDRLEHWDGTMRRELPEPLIWSAWLNHLHRRLFADELGVLLADYGRVRPDLIARLLVEYPSWCDDRRTAAVEPCGDIVAGALVDAVTELSRAYGENLANWRWGEAHKARFVGRIWDGIPGLRRLLASEVPTDGGDYTVNRGTPRLGERPPEEAFRNVHAAGYRAVYDLADLDRSLFGIALGQSGIPFSENFHDLARPWADGIYRTMPEIPAAAARTLELLPR